MHGGHSSVYAIGHEPGDERGWAVGLSHPWEPGRRIALLRLRDREHEAMYNSRMRWKGEALRDTLARYFTERVILITGWVLFLIYAYPGYMSFDSAWQLTQARRIEPIDGAGRHVTSQCQLPGALCRPPAGITKISGCS